jgi:hypothetical protein
MSNPRIIDGAAHVICPIQQTLASFMHVGRCKNPPYKADAVLNDVMRMRILTPRWDGASGRKSPKKNLKYLWLD